MKKGNVESINTFKGKTYTFKGKTYTFNGYTVNETGVYDSNNKLITKQIIYPTKRITDIEDDTEKTELYFESCNKWKSVVVNNNIIANKNKIINLADVGLDVNSSNALGIVKFISDTISYNSSVIDVVEATSKIGWYNGTFIPYSNEVFFSGDINFRKIYEAVNIPSGDNSNWLKLATKGRKHIIPRLMMDISLSSVLLEKTGSLPFVTLIWGGTGTGKTVSMMLSASIWGNPRRR